MHDSVVWRCDLPRGLAYAHNDGAVQMQHTVRQHARAIEIVL
jgi:hypothetical protein